MSALEADEITETASAFRILHLARAVFRLHLAGNRFAQLACLTTACGADLERIVPPDLIAPNGRERNGFARVHLRRVLEEQIT